MVGRRLHFSPEGVLMVPRPFAHYCAKYFCCLFAADSSTQAGLRCFLTLTKLWTESVLKQSNNQTTAALHFASLHPLRKQEQDVA